MLATSSSQVRMNYSNDVIQLMQKFYASLSEKDRRRYAAVEASKIGHGGISYISKVLGCSRDTIKSGKEQLESLSASELSAPNVRKQGAGRKRTLETMSGLEEAFIKIMEFHDSQELTEEKLSQRKIIVLLEKEGFKVSPTVVRQLIRQYKANI